MPATTTAAGAPADADSAEIAQRGGVFTRRNLLVASEVCVDLRLALLGVLGIVVNGLGAHQVWTMEVFHL